MANKSNNTTAKGDAFEERVYHFIDDCIQKGEIPVNGNQSKVFLKKKYDSKDTENGVIIDVAIETYAAGSDDISYLTLIECKDYDSAIDIGEIREFDDKIKELNANKGYFFTTSSFQMGARNKAKACHIGLAVIDESGQRDWITRRIAIRSRYKVEADIINVILGQPSEMNYPFVAEGEHYYTNFFDFLHDELNIPIPQALVIKYLSDDQILNVIYDKFHLTPDSHFTIQDSELLGFISAQGYQIQSSSLHNKVLGEIDFETKQIFISDSLSAGSPRWRFTVAHELGHILLHSNSITDSKIQALEEHIDDDVSDSSFISNKTIARMEIQANSFASQLLIPAKAFLAEYYRLFQNLGVRNFPNLMFDGTPWNDKLYDQIVGSLAIHFMVSKAAIDKKLQSLQFIKEGWT